MKKRLQVDISENTVNLLDEIKEKEDLSNGAAITRAVTVYSGIRSMLDKGSRVYCIAPDGKETEVILL